jgi:hypothetical protein
MSPHKKKSNSIPKQQKVVNTSNPSHISQQLGFVILGTGAGVIGLIALINVLNPSSYNYSTPSPDKFLADCKTELQKIYPGSALTSTPKPLSRGNKGVLTLFFTPQGGTGEQYFECYQDKSGNLSHTNS